MLRDKLIGILCIVAVAVVGCSAELAAAPTAPSASRLSIAARDHAPGHPPQGWCGETAIQEALLHYGAFVPQRAINRAGKPSTPDLYAGDIPVALRALGLAYRWWRNRGDIHAFIRWIKRQIRAGKPVLVGVKINPTGHPSWGLDHFVLAVGYDSTGLLLNTTWGRAERRSYADLSSRRKGFSFLNRSRRYYGLVIDGLHGKYKTAVPVSMSAQRETKTRIDARITATKLVKGARYQLRRYIISTKKPTVVARFVASAASKTLQIRVDKRRASFFAITRIR